MTTTCTSSVATGIFVFKKSTKRKRKEQQEKPSWHEHYTRTWDALEQQLQGLNDAMFSGLLSNITSFLQQERGTDGCIPTATILTGINVPDHSLLFSKMESHLRCEISPHVARLSARLCPKVRPMLGQILRQCQNLKHQQQEADFEDSDEEGEHSMTRRVLGATFTSLSQWLSNQHPGEKKQPLVVVLEDFESFSPRVLEDFIYMASEYRDQVPLSLVLGVSTTETAVQASLPHRAMSKLSMGVFMCENSNTLLHQLINKVILAPDCKFKVGGRVFRLLTDNFLFYDFSVQSFLQKFKLCLLEHYSGRLSKLVCAVDSRHEIQQLDKSDVQQILLLPSCRAYVESKEPSERSRLLRDPVYFKDVVANLLEDLQKHFSFFLVGLACLKELVASLPGAPLGKNLRDMYLSAISKPVWKCEEWAACTRLWRLFSSYQLIQNLTSIINIFTSNVNKENGQLRLWAGKLKSAKRKLLSLEKETTADSSSKSVLTEVKTSATQVGELCGLTRIQLKEQLRENATRNGPTLNKFECLREEIVTMLEDMLVGGVHSLLYPPGMMPLHELLIFDDSLAVKDEIIGNSRAALTNALSNPHHYLRCTCCELQERSEVLPTLPEVSIAYKLYMESGKHINLYDWLQAFHCVVTAGEEPEVTTESQARFTQAVSELQFLGFIKSSTRKTDHVIRLTWGSC